MSRESRSLVFLLAGVLIGSFLLWIAGCTESTSPEEEVVDSAPALESVTALDRYHIEVEFDEEVDRATAEHRHNYSIDTVGITTSPESALLRGAAQDEDTLSVRSAVLLADSRSVLLSVYPSLDAVHTYQLKAWSIEDLFGNAITEPDSMDFIGSGDLDETVPFIVERSPAPGATGVGVGQSVIITFSEQMDEGSVQTAFTLSAGGNITCDMENVEGNIFVFTPQEVLVGGVTHNVNISGAAMDWSGNHLAADSWSFITTDIEDVTPPTVVSTTPADGATNVPLDIVLQIEFSEPIDPASLSEGILMTPEPGDGIMSWIDGGRTLNFDPDEPLLDNTAYSLIITEGAVRDYAGNPLEELYSLQFTTAAAFPTGAILGTISGDPNSTAAADPEGTLAIAFMDNIFSGEEENGPPPIGGVAVAGEGGVYEINRLMGGWYWPVGWMDTNGDGMMDPEYGDALGAYGVDFSNLEGEPEPDSVEVSGGFPVPGIDFALYDPIAIYGRVTYEGTAYPGTLENYNYHVGLFDTLTYDPGNLDPEYGTDPQNIVWDPYFNVNEFEDGLVEGSYYIGAYMDVNYNGDYDPETDPAGFYEEGGELAWVTVENGEDSGDGIVVVLQDPVVLAKRGISWASWVKPASSKGSLNPALLEAIEKIRRALEEQ
jgi:hypothetical protein